MTSNGFWVSIFMIVAVAITGYFMVKRIFFHQYYKDVVLADEFLITTDRKILEAKGLVVADKDVNIIAVGVAPPFKAFDAKNGIRTPDGQIVNPEIILVDAEGDEYPLKYKGARLFKDYDFANYKYVGPKGKKFEKVLLRSDVPIPATRILWSGYNIKDLP